MALMHKHNRKAAKTTPAMVREIRERYASGAYSQGDLCRDYGISIAQIGRIVRYEAWVNLPDTEETSIARGIDSALAAASEVSARESLAKAIQEVKDRETLPDRVIEELQADLGDDAKSRLGKLLGK